MSDEHHASQWLIFFNFFVLQSQDAAGVRNPLRIARRKLRPISATNQASVGVFGFIMIAPPLRVPRGRAMTNTTTTISARARTGAFTMSSRLALMAFVVLGAGGALADDMKMPVNGKDIKWGPAPPFFPKGAEFAVLSGDPGKDGLYVVRLKMPAGYKIPAHNHPTTENVTIVSGNFHIGMGDRLDEKKAIELTAGGYGEAPAKMNHYAWVTSPTIVQVHGQGPFAITYVNPADDPSKK
jgi:quercetin dioxygenase-like cupin family protein